MSVQRVATGQRPVIDARQSELVPIVTTVIPAPAQRHRLARSAGGVVDVATKRPAEIRSAAAAGRQPLITGTTVAAAGAGVTVVGTGLAWLAGWYGLGWALIADAAGWVIALLIVACLVTAGTKVARHCAGCPDH